MPHSKLLPFLICLALTGCGGWRNEIAAVGLGAPPAAETAAKPAPDEAYAQARAADARGDMDEAERLYVIAADGGTMDARLALGVMYLSGRGVHKDYAAALHWLEPAAKAGNAEAQVRVGLIYEAGGQGVTIDATKALGWYDRAAAQGNANAQYRAGFIMLQAILGHEDPSRAMQYFQAAAAQGHVQAMTAIGQLLLQGRAGRQDIPGALTWLKRGIAGGDPDAMLILGRLYWEGERVPKNIPEGTRLLRQAEALGSEEAHHELALPPL